MASLPFYFAWVGGPLVPPIDVATTGDVWGGELLTGGTTWGGELRTRGDITNGGYAVTNMLSDAGLRVGQVYLVQGKGIQSSIDGVSPDTYFTFTGGRGGDLSEPSTEGVAGADLVFTSEEGRELVFIEKTTGLVNGRTYGVEGSGIPQGATAVWAGGSPLQISEPATTTSRLAAIRIASAVGRSTLKNVADTSSLDVGGTYEVFGQGVTAGTTATYSGGGELALSAPANVTGTGVPVRIMRGAEYPDGGPFDETAHAREDEKVLDLEITHSEGDFASATVSIRNPGEGLLATGRFFWAWISWQNGDTVEPLFHGRLVGSPEDLQGEVLKLTFIARPEDYPSIKAALAATMRERPYWDPVWLVEKADDPDTVLEARTQLWHVDRVTLEVTASDITQGEDGTLVISEALHLYDNLRLSYAQAPLRRVAVNATVTWDQVGIGDLDLTEPLWRAFQAAGCEFGFPLVSSFTGDGLYTSWPKPRTSIGGGWTVGDECSVVQAIWQRSGRYAVRYMEKAPAANPQQDSTRSQLGFVAQTILQQAAFPKPGQAMMAGWKVYDVLFDLTVLSINFPVHYEAIRKRSETVSFILEADVQSIMTEPGAAEEENISLSSEYVWQPVDTDGSVPLGDLRRNTYFKTDRGAQSFEYPLMLARARLIHRARAVVVKLRTRWITARLISCRWSVELHDRRLPGGVVTGKVSSYTLRANGDGEMFADLTIHCMIGRGNSVTASDGTPAYVGDGYMDSGQQVRGAQVSLGDVTYQSFDDLEVIDDDGVDFFNMTPDSVVVGLSVTGGPAEQRAAIDEGVDQREPDPVGYLKLHPTRVELDLLPVTGGSFQTYFSVLTSQLMVPMTIDLGAPHA